MRRRPRSCLIAVMYYTHRIHTVHNNTHSNTHSALLPVADAAELEVSHEELVKKGLLTA